MDHGEIISFVLAAELIDYCRQAIAGFKVPRAVRFVSEWPMSTSKIQKFRLREQWASGVARGGLRVLRRKPKELVGKITVGSKLPIHGKCDRNY